MLQNNTRSTEDLCQLPQFTSARKVLAIPALASCSHVLHFLGTWDRAHSGKSAYRVLGFVTARRRDSHWDGRKDVKKKTSCACFGEVWTSHGGTGRHWETLYTTLVARVYRLLSRYCPGTWHLTYKNPGTLMSQSDLNTPTC